MHRLRRDGPAAQVRERDAAEDVQEHAVLGVRGRIPAGSEAVAGGGWPALVSAFMQKS